MRKVLIGTPAYDGRVDVWYANSLVNTIRLSYEKNITIVPVYMAYDSLVQRARNDLVKLAIEEDFDDLIFIDADQEWDPAWIFKLLDSDKDVIAGTVVKKSDQPAFNVKALEDGVKLDGELAEVDCVGTGFMPAFLIWKRTRKGCGYIPIVDLLSDLTSFPLLCMPCYQHHPLPRPSFLLNEFLCKRR